MNAERSGPAVDPGAAIARAASTREPLGAYADDDALHYLFMGSEGVLDLTVPRTPYAAAPAASDLLPLFDWHEREMLQTRDVVLAGEPDARPLFIEDGPVPPALTAEGKGVTVIVVGPVHAGIIEPGRFTFSSGGETVIHLDAQLSYSRRGVERQLEGRDARAAVRHIARVCGGCSVARSWAYARALEDLAGVGCDERSEWARVVLAELERLYNHVFDLACACAGAGYGYGQTQGLALKERLHRILAAVGGHRFGFDAIVPGGVAVGVLGDPETPRAALAAAERDVRAYTTALFANRSLARRFAGSGILPLATARAFGATGPARRACGDALDVRGLLPYGAYAATPLSIPSDPAGDVAARERIRVYEIGESFTLIERALRELARQTPPPPKQLAPAAGSVTTVTEGPRGTESVSLTCDDAGLLRRVHLISASYRNWPVVLRAMEGNIVPDFPLVNKSFNLCYACADR